MGFIYFLIKSFEKAVLSLYFRKINVMGEENIPEEGPLIICGNHANQFIDPMMIMANTRREISFTMAASSYSKPVVGQLAKALKVIPVHRPEDHKKQGTGKIRFESETELSGVDTQFLQDLEKLKINKTGLSLFISNVIITVEKIVSDSAIKIKANPEAKSLVESKDKQFDFFFIPKVDNSDLFKDAYRRLSENGCICIFPEGTSHDRTDFLKLKAGIALMALGAMSEGKCSSVRVLPVGLNYFKREEFRSEVNIEFGKAFEIPKEWAELYKTNKREATEKLLVEIEYRMKSVTLTAPSYIELKSLFIIRNLYIPTDVKVTPTQYTEICKRFVKGYEKLKENETIKNAMTQVNEYTNELDKVGLRDRNVRSDEFTYTWIVKKNLYSFFLAILFIILCLPALLLLTPFAYILKNKAEQERIAAKKKNPNKLEAKDVVSSVKIQYSILLMPFIFVIWSILFYFGFNCFLNGKLFNLGFLNVFLLGSVIFPFYLYFSAIMLDYVFFSFYTMISRFQFFFNPSRSRALKQKRQSLSDNIKRIVDAHIEEVDPKYKEQRILFNEESAAQLTEEKILIRRNSLRKSSYIMNSQIEAALEMNKEQKY